MSPTWTSRRQRPRWQTSPAAHTLSVTWSAPANTGRPAIVSYDLRYRRGASGSWTDGPQDHTGTTAVITGLDADTSYEVQVRATNDEGDGEWSPSSIGTTVDIPNNAPTFSESSATPRAIIENSAAGTTIGAPVTATDADGDTLTYSLEGPDAASFYIDPSSGQIRTRADVTYDHETKQSYSVTVRADDGNGGTATAAITIAVTDVDEPPAAPAVADIAGDAHTLSVTWSAPANTGQPAIVSYDLRYRRGASGSWTDGPQDQTGTTAVITGLDADASYEVQVRATNDEGDGEWSSSSTGTTVDIPNNAPTFSDGSETTREFVENSTAGTNIGTPVTATDADGDTLSYSLEGTDAASFDIDASSGQIRTRAGVTYDHETKQSYSVTVRADDGNGGTDTVAITIAVTDVDEPPAAPAAPAVSVVADSSDTLSVTWSAPANTGQPAIVSYDLRYRRGASGSWTDGPQDQTGTSAVITGLVADASYEVQVRATNDEGDGEWSSSSTGTTVDIPNNAPTFSESSATPRAIIENSAAGTNIGAPVTATDADADSLTYSLEGPDAASFDIDPSSGQIRTRAGVTYDHETKQSYSVTVRADDGNGGTDTVAITITVTDVDEPQDEQEEQEQRIVTEVVQTVAAATVANVAANIGTRFSAARGGGLTGGGGVSGRAPVVKLGSIPAFPLSTTPDSPTSVDEYEWNLPEDTGVLDHSLELGLADLLNGAAFEMPLNATDDATQAAGGAPRLTLWGRGDLQLFDSDPNRGSRYDGDLKAGYLGIESRLGERWLAGLATSLTRSEADYAVESGAAKDGRLEMSLTSVHPYLRYAPGGAGEYWALLGAGQGEIEIGAAGAATRETSDVTMWMGSAGARRALAPAGALDLALLGDFGFARVETDEALRVIDRLNVDVWRARVGAEGSFTRALDNGGTVTPLVEVAGRLDGGDGDDNETGLEISPALYIASADGRFGVEARGHWLALYSAESYTEYGASVTASVSPRPGGLGLSLSVAPRWGTGVGGAGGTGEADALWRDDTIGRSSEPGATRHRAMSLDARAGYGVRAMGGVLTPFGQLGLREEASRRVRLGVRFAGARSDALPFHLELAGERFESGANAPDHRLRLNARARF